MECVLGSHADDAPEAFPLQHVVKCFVDIREGDFMGDEFLQLQVQLLQH